MKIKCKYNNIKISSFFGYYKNEIFHLVKHYLNITISIENVPSLKTLHASPTV